MWSSGLGAGRKAKRMVLQCINGSGFKSRRGKNKNLTALKSNSNTVWFNFQTYTYLYKRLICCTTTPKTMLKYNKNNYKSAKRL